MKLSDNPRLTDQGLRSLRNLKALESLELSSTPIDRRWPGPTWPGLTKLTSLGLDRTPDRRTGPSRSSSACRSWGTLDTPPDPTHRQRPGEPIAVSPGLVDDAGR